jgi:cytochrome c-type biogenesis protein CcmH
VRASWVSALTALGALAAATAAWGVDPTQLSDPALQARYEALTHELRCMQCQNESLADSPVDLAADLRHEVRDQLLAGKSDDDIRAWMSARYGDFILFRPRYSLRNAWLWGAPAALLLIGTLVSWRVVRNRGTLLATDNEPLPPPQDAVLADEGTPALDQPPGLGWTTTAEGAGNQLGAGTGRHGHRWYAARRIYGARAELAESLDHFLTYPR